MYEMFGPRCMLVQSTVHAGAVHGACWCSPRCMLVHAGACWCS